MRRVDRTKTIVWLALAIGWWLVAAQWTLAADVAPSAAERKSADAILSVKDGKPFDTPGCPLEERFFADTPDGRLDAFSPFDAALIASGVENVDDLHRYQRKMAALADELRRSGKLVGTLRERVEAVFAFVHRKILGGGYDLAYTDVRRVLDEGRYNCVSATVLFNCLAGELGLDARALEMPGHTLSRVWLPDGPLDVENTCPRWFSLGGDPQRQPTAGTPLIGAMRSMDRSKAREVSPIQMAAMVYYNRGVDLLSEKRFAEATGVNAKALRLDPENATARGNLLATINNWSIELGNSQRYAEAIGLLRRGLAMDRKFEPFAQNYVHVHHQWIEHLCGQGRFEEAIAILSRAAAEMPDRDYLRKARGDVSQRWSKSVSGSRTGTGGARYDRPSLRLECKGAQSTTRPAHRSLAQRD